MSYQQITPTQTQQAGPVVYTYLPQVTDSVSSNDNYNSQQSNLGTGWIIAIVALVLLAIVLTYNFWNWRRKRNAGRYQPKMNNYADSQEYMLQRPRAARVRDSIPGFRSSGYV